MTPDQIVNGAIPVIETMPEPVFVVGMNGSGTSMLADSLGRHPELYMTRRETRILPYLVGRLEKFGDLNVDRNFLALWDAVLGIRMFRRLNQGETPPLPSNWRQFPRNLEAVLDAVFRHFAGKEGKVRWGEKTPQHVQHQEMLHGLFPGAKFIHIIRDGRDCAASFNRRWQRNADLTIYRWKNIVREGRRQGHLLSDVYFELRYEDLTSEPEYWMRKICGFAGLEFDETILVSSQPYKQGRLKNGRIEPNSGKWRKFFTESEVNRLERIAGSRLDELGYPVENVAGDEDPGRLNLWRWMLEDYGRQFLTQLKYDLRNNNKKVFGKMFHAVATAFKQKRSNRF